MSGVINDIDALAEFRAHLMQFNRDLAENFATIRGHWRELGRSGGTTCTGGSARRSMRSRRASPST